MRVAGADTGGTFTDIVLFERGRIRVRKVPSTPSDPSAALIEGLEALAAERGARAAPDGVRHGSVRHGSIEEVRHGSTVATNALLERKGARTGFVTTRGFRDVLAIGRQTRPSLYDLDVTRPEPLVERSLRLEIEERVGADGVVLVPVRGDDRKTLERRLRRARVESVAVGLLFSFAHPEHERAVRRVLATLDVPISLSCEVSPEYREYERFSTTVVNAYLAPVMERHVRRLATRLGGEARVEASAEARGKARGKARSPSKGTPDERPDTRPNAQPAGARLRVMLSNGGLAAPARVIERPVATVLSGPAAGVIGAQRTAGAAGFERIITFDMGGTSTDVALVDGEPVHAAELEIGGSPLRLPVIDIHTVGAGGGSIARVDAGGALRVGPQSAGADPGPACYGRGEDATVTDANVVLGRIRPDGLLGGDMELDVARAERAVARVAEAIGMPRDRAAAGILRVAAATMERAIKVISLERGHDPRDYALVSFGGAGGLHAVELARSLGMATVVVPPFPGALSAVGLGLADARTDRSLTVLRSLDDATPAAIEKIFGPLEAEARAELEREGVAPAKIRVERRLRARYAGQAHELDLPVRVGARQTQGKGKKHGERTGSGAGAGTRAGAALVRAFHALHEKRYGVRFADRPVEWVHAHARAVGRLPRPTIASATSGPRSRATPGSGRGRKAPVAATARVHTGTKREAAAIVRRDDLRPGHVVRGPAVVTEYSGTLWLPPDASARVVEGDCLVVSTNAAAKGGRGGRNR